MRYQTAIKYTRQNTGKHFLDSGGASGRIWQQPAPPENEPIIYGKEPCDASISVTQLLVDAFEQESATQAAFARWQKDRRGDWFELCDTYLEGKGFRQLRRGNTYNAENDLDQQFCWEVWERPGSSVNDWLFCDSWDVLIVVYAHCGADVRGGYSAPIFGNFKGEYSVPIDLCVEWYFAPFVDDDDDAAEACDAINESGKGSRGYSSNPFYYLESDCGVCWGSVDEPRTRDKDGRACYFVTIDGAACLAYPQRPCMGE